MVKNNTKKTFFKPKVPQRTTNLTWDQSKKRFPKLNPYGDVDHDGVKNYRDCKPFNIKKQGKEHDDEAVIDFKDIKKLKTVGDVKKLSESFRRRDKDE